jgi:ParB family chromosome partitioning protein
MKRSLSSLITDTNVREFNALEIEVKLIKESSSQARTEFNDSKLNELTESIRKNGVLQPLIVQEVTGDQYELIAGERRLRASKLAGLERIPCLVKDVSSRDAAVIGLVENIQRDQLNAIDESTGFQHLVETYNLESKEIALLVGKSRSYVSNSLRLSKLSLKVISSLKSGEVTMGQIRPLINLPNSLQEKILDEIKLLRLSSRQVEDKVRSIHTSDPSTDEMTIFYKNYFEDKTGSKAIVQNKKDKFKVILNFNSSKALKEFVEKIN